MKISTLNLEEEYRNLLEREFPISPILHTQLNQLSDHVLSQVDSVFTYGYDITPKIVKKMDSLRWLHIGQSGMDPLPFDLLREKKVFITNSRGINSSTISEYVLCAMLNVVRNTFVLAEKAKQKIWDTESTMDELLGKTIGIFGLGMVGTEIAKRAKAFGMRVLGIDIFTTGVPNVDQMFIPDKKMWVLSECDFVVLCMPLLSTTKGMIGRKELTVMKPSSWLINVGRGPLVQTRDLIEAIDAKKIAGAVLDVFPVEPLSIQDELWNRENIIITPHVAGDHFSQYAPRMVEIIRFNLTKYPVFDQMKNQVEY